MLISFLLSGERMEEPCSVGASVCRWSNKLLMSFVCFYHGPEVLCFFVHCLLYHGPLVSMYHGLHYCCALSFVFCFTRLVLPLGTKSCLPLYKVCKLQSFFIVQQFPSLL